MNTLFDLCTPREDVLGGNIKESDFAADLAQVLNEKAPIEYRDPAIFFANTHPTQGLRHLCLLYTSPSPRDGLLSRMPSSA